MDDFVILLVLRLLGLVSSYMLGGLIHPLLGLALVILIINLVMGAELRFEPAHVAHDQEKSLRIEV